MKQVSRAVYVVVMVTVLVSLSLAIDPKRIAAGWRRASEVTASQAVPERVILEAPAARSAQPGGDAANLIPWDFGAIFDNLMYQINHTAAWIAWVPHLILLTISYVIHRISDVLISGILPLVLNLIIPLIESLGYVELAALMGLVLVTLSILGSSMNLRLGDLRKVILYIIIAALMFSQGPDFMQKVEETRMQLAADIYERTYRKINDSGVLNGILGGAAAPEGWASFELRSYYSGGLSAEDAALSVVGAQAGEESRGSLPSAFASEFFPHSSIRQRDEGSRSDALMKSTYGVILLIMAYPVSWVAVIEGVMQLLFGIAAFFLLISLPISLVFAFFLPTEGIFLGLLKQYIYLLIYYLMLQVLISIGLSGLIVAASRGSVPLAVGGSVFALIFYSFGMNLAKQSAMSSFTALSGSMAQTMGFKDPLGSVVNTAAGAVRTAGSLAVGATGAGLALAAGAPALAPSLLAAGAQAGGGGGFIPGGGSDSAGLDDGQNAGWQSPTLQGMQRQKDWLRVGTGIVGGRLMKGTPLQGAATSLATMRSRGVNLNEAMQGATAADAALVGLTRGGGMLDDFIVMDRISRRASQAGSASASAASQPQVAPPSQQESKVDFSRIRYHTSASSPWKAEVHQALSRYGDEWGDQIAQAIVRTLHNYEAQDMSGDEIRARFTRDGAPSLRTAGGRDVFDNLPLETRQTLGNTDAQRAVAGMIGEAVMPRIEISRDVLVGAIADAVREGFPEGQGAQAVAAQLGTSAEGLGSNYGVINNVANEVVRSGLSADGIEATLRTGNVIDGRSDLAQKREMLPNQITFRKSTLSEDA